MIPRLLSSLQHPLVKKLVKLRESRQLRSQEKTVLIVGEQLVRDVAEQIPLNILISEKEIGLKADEVFLGTADVLKKIIGLETHDLVAAVVSIPKMETLEGKKNIIVLEGLSDPGNVGTILRTALALGWDGAFLTPQTADPFNDKALRAARGAPLFLPIRQGSFEELTNLIQSNKMMLYVADVEGENLTDCHFKPPLALLLGHETEGPSDAAKKLGQLVSIPMTNKIESLNVASAAAIIMYKIKEKI